jgi:hypothetical protein
MKNILPLSVVLAFVIGIIQSCGTIVPSLLTNNATEDEPKIQRMHVLPINFTKWDSFVQLDAGVIPPKDGKENTPCTIAAPIKSDGTTLFSPLQTFWAQIDEHDDMVPSFHDTFFIGDQVNHRDFKAKGLRALSSLNKKFFSIEKIRFNSNKTQISATFRIPMASIELDIRISSKFQGGICKPVLTALPPEGPKVFTKIKIKQNILGLVKDLEYL